jgi:hypothetical protein
MIADSLEQILAQAIHDHETAPWASRACRRAAAAARCVKDSGWGRSGPASMSDFTELQWITTRDGTGHYPI